jgi:hypothetical protein
MKNVRDLVRDKVDNQIWSEVKSLTSNRVLGQVDSQIWNQVSIQVQVVYTQVIWRYKIKRNSYYGRNKMH